MEVFLRKVRVGLKSSTRIVATVVAVLQHYSQIAHRFVGALQGFRSFRCLSCLVRSFVLPLYLEASVCAILFKVWEKPDGFGCTFSPAVNESSARCGKSFMRIDADMYADLRIENMPKASMSRRVGMNRKFEGGSVCASPLIFSGLVCGCQEGRGGAR